MRKLLPFIIQGPFDLRLATILATIILGLLALFSSTKWIIVLASLLAVIELAIAIWAIKNKVSDIGYVFQTNNEK